MPMQNCSRASVPGPLRATPSVETPSRTIGDLRREQPELEIDDRVHLRGRGSHALRVTGDRVHHLRDQTIANRLTGRRLRGRPASRRSGISGWPWAAAGDTSTPTSAAHRSDRDRPPPSDVELRARRGRRARRESVPSASSRLKARRRCRIVETSAPSQLEPSLVRKIGSSPSRAVEAIAQLRGRDAPCLRGPMTRRAAPPVGPEVLEERVAGVGLVHADDRRWTPLGLGNVSSPARSRRSRRGACRRDHYRGRGRDERHAGDQPA